MNIEIWITSKGLIAFYQLTRTDNGELQWQKTLWTTRFIKGYYAPLLQLDVALEDHSCYMPKYIPYDESHLEQLCEH